MTQPPEQPDPVVGTVDDTVIRAAAPAGEPLALHYSAISDVGRVRKDNQDSGYAGPWLLTVCDGVGGAARGDIASSTAVSELRALDVDPATTGDVSGPGQTDLLDRVTHALHDAHEQIGRLVDADPTINGTSTTATVALFDGRRVGIGHVGDSRAYLFRDNEISQLTTDHTFVQSLIDEGRITEAEARVHPHRNLILKALDGIHEAEPDLFMLELVAGDRLFLCSDGACGVLDDGRLADILSMGTPDFAAVELVRASLEAGSSDNVTCIVADVVTEQEAAADPSYAELEPMLVGAAAELKRKLPRGLFRGHRSGDTGELEPIEAEIPDDLPHAVATDPLVHVDPETARYAPQPRPRYAWLRSLMAAVIVVGLLWIGAAAAWSWVQRQYYVGEQDGVVVIHRGVDASLPGLDLSEVVVVTTLRVDDLEEFDRDMVRDGIPVDDLSEARDRVEELSAKRRPADPGTGG
ncbi:PP2C family protein-serine/threonine phosphatase [Nocardioides rubriscoriae]|uniref:PP2C family protein-serine/threonine phosphatase n=1 Tax=Nocardioides rubriscoriae TaxID=642762 RepID=UPI001FE99439|nr:protein phosphatase 2C domain-containing protein [Nocardioides rubriscoriae]